MRVKKNYNNIFILFAIFHLVIWTLVPAITNINLPLDTIEALVWGNNLAWGYSKHPPLSAWTVEIVYKIFGSKDWAYYFLSQLFVVSAFFIIFKFSEDFFKNKIHSLISILLLEGIYFYNFTTPEFNVNVCQIPFWALTVYFCWRGIKKNDTISWLLFGLCAGLGVLSKYLFIYLLIAIDVLFIYLILNKKLNFKCLISLISFFLVIAPHLIWLQDNNYTTITYAFHRTGLEKSIMIDHLLNPLIFLGKQFVILVPFFVMLLSVVRKFNIKLNLKDKKLIFLLIINFVPIILIFLTSLLIGAKIKTMWMTPFYLFMGVLFVYVFQKKIDLKKIKYFFSIFLILFVFSPTVYSYISITQQDKRTDYPGKKISKIVQEKWDKNFSDKIGLVGGDEWQAGNLSYHLKSRPKWDNILEGNNDVKFENVKGGFLLIGEPDILSNICEGVFFEVETQGICMMGNKK